MYRACELKDQTYKKTRTLHFSELVQTSEYNVKIRMDHQLCPQSCRFVLLRILAILRPLQILSPFWAPLNFAAWKKGPEHWKMK